MERGQGKGRLEGMYFSIIGSIMTHSYANEIHIHKLHSNHRTVQSPKNVLNFFSKKVYITVYLNSLISAL